MFGRRNRENRDEAERELSRRALFEELAKRPHNICPFLGLASSQTEYHDGFTREHRCYAFGDPVELSVEQQERVCLGRGYGNCPRYLRGVLVIPTEELEALRRPLPPAGPPEPPVVPTPPVPAEGGGGGRRGLLIGAILLLAVASAAGAFLFLKNGGTANNPTPTPQASSQPSPGASVLPSAEASVSTTPTAIPFETPVPAPTPLPGDTFVGYDVTVLEGQNPIFEIDAEGITIREVIAVYSRFSTAPVARIEAPNGLLHWRTTEGDNTGLSYIRGRSGGFLIREVYQGADGTRRYKILPEQQT